MLFRSARKDGVYSKNKAYFTQLEAGLKVNLDSEINKNIKLLKNRLSYEFLSRYYDSYTVLKYAACPDSAVILSRPARTRTASSASSWAEPRCSTIRRTPCSLATICTAVAPEAVRTFRTNGLTPPPYNHPLVPRTHHPDRTTPTKNPHHDATSPKLARVRFNGRIAELEEEFYALTHGPRGSQVEREAVRLAC